MSSTSILPGPVEGQQHSGLRRALRLAALAPFVAGSMALAAPGFAGAQDAPEEPIVEVVEELVSDAPTISSVLPRPGGLTVTFVPAEGSSALFHIVSAKLDDEVKAVEVVSADVTKASLTGLVNGTEYDVVVTAINLLGLNDSSEVTKATPLADGSAVIAPLAVQNLEVTRSKHSATATWDAPANDGGSPVKLYVMNVVDESTGKLVMWRNLPADVRSASVAPLANGIAYEINVFALSAAGFGAVESVSDVLGSASLANPLAPSVPWASAYVNDAGMVVANWGAAEEHGVPVFGYNAVIVQDDELVGWNVVGPNGRSVVVSGLDETQDAVVYVFSTSGIGYGPAQMITIEAPVEPPAEV